MREHRVKERAVSDDFGKEKVPSEDVDGAQTSSEGALLGRTSGEAGFEVAWRQPVHGSRAR
jgi:hypothetical protein